MSSGHASHKSTSMKPNPNAVNGQNAGEEERDIQPESGYPFDADSEAETNPAALQREPSESDS
ncbi:hypothetical protein ACN4EK_06525 [Pantanalinema rosaneae CENA516]|uniref:hypothetical protein n=1 Tax=Pantanalinema rosaneae TaxID=1620701 RepID=UPI003D6FF719